MIAPAAEARHALQLFEAAVGATNVVHHPQYARQPPGGLVAADVAREAASMLLADLRDLGRSRARSFRSRRFRRSRTWAFAAAYGAWEDVEGAALQLIANVASIIFAGLATLAVQRA